MTNPYSWVDSSLEAIRKANWYRSVRTIDSRPGAVVEMEGRSLLNFASNDYLGLAGDDRLIAAAVEATRRWGTGSTGSRLLSGHRSLHRDLERAIADFKQTEDALVFSSGYLANLGTIAALVGKRDLIFADRYNHSSLKSGAILSGATVREYPHNNVTELKLQLQQWRSHYRRCLILTDSVFSMDGDICPLPQLLDLSEEFESMLLIDEAHATGVLGATGAGSPEHFGLRHRPLIQMGTLSKALGSLGGYVAGSAPLIDYLRNRSASWIYTTGLSPADTAAALEAIAILKQEPQRLVKLRQNVTHLQQFISEKLTISEENAERRSPKLLPSGSPILCVQLDDPALVLSVGDRLKENGILASAVRPPTVPTSRLRITVMATHETSHLQQLVESLVEILRTPR
ncbi:MAG TPA: 8-amino-7-oxononanoate synthase [Oscillatoriales cyanobacterium M59_W2019_021]|nr:MAG: 8-amino-7-oxononanoate synthase [Cyanobacteria bacterium J055]HIK33102.1 8-amino-7-oxononanoate synthase [Oscillatoriales cyanobacterium M4454_W2019_049]HIK51510.1 8-amino-7-oxononanoate synthase [Oscillatoriales cyanobacterium M59_W2019_021]